MNLGPLKRYESELKHWVYQYAYENYWSPPLINKLECDWHGEVFDVADIDTNLHHDIWQDLKTKDILKYIRKYCDKFVILPDVFSNSPVPIRTDRNEFDMDRPNIVLINGKIWEIEHKRIERHYVYNHNRHTYIFFDSKTGGDLYITPAGQTPEMKVISVFTNCFIIEDVKNTEKWWQMTDEWYGLEINGDDKIATESDTDVAGIYIHAPYMEFNYDDEVTEEKEPVIHGLMSQSEDQWIRPKWYYLLQDQTFIHNEGVLFTNTAIVFYKDGTYHIENTYLNDRGKHIEKVDKHTIRIYHDNSIKKIVFFLRFYNQVQWARPDSLYYEATKENPYSTLEMRLDRKKTNALLDYMNWNMDRSIDDIIDWGYKYDRDILVTIQNYFPRIQRLNKHTDIKVIEYWNGEKFYKPKFAVTCMNKLQAYPALFIDHKLYMADYRIVKNEDCDILILDPEQFWKLIGYTPTEYVQPTAVPIARGVPEPEYKPPQNFIDPYMDLEWLKSNLLASITDIRVILTSYKTLNSDEVSYQGGRVFRNPLRRDLVVDWYGDNPVTIGGYPFVNGYMTTDLNNDKRFRIWDSVNIFDYGEPNFTTTASENPTSLELVDYGDKHHIFNDDRQTLLINRTTQPFNGVCRLYFNDPAFEHVIDYYGHDIPSLGADKTFKVHQTVAFDKYGLECTDKIFVVCNHYVNFDYMYNYLHDPAYGVNPEMTVTLFDLKLRDDKRQYDLEIDEDRINKVLNVGSFNENSMKRQDIRALFNPNKPAETRVIPITLKHPGQLLGEKILTRYWLGIRGVLSNPEKYKTEVSTLNGKYVNPDGTLGTVPESCKAFNADNRWNDYPLILRMISEAETSAMLAGAGVNYIKFKDVVIDSSDNYTGSFNNVEHVHIKAFENRLIVRSTSDVDLYRSVYGIPADGELEPPTPEGELTLVDVTNDPETVDGVGDNATVTLHYDYV